MPGWARGKRRWHRTLCDLRPGERGVVVAVRGQGPIRRRLLDMGMTPGTVVQVVRVAPLGDPVQVTCKGTALAIRRSEGEEVEIR